MSAAPSPHYVDLHVGARLRMRRKTLNLSQGAVAGAVGLTFQQLQKYERGANRISASKLHALSGVLSTSVSWFFEGLPDPTVDASALEVGAADTARTTQAFLMSPEGLALAQLFPTLPSSARRHVLGLCHTLAEAADET